MIQIDKSAPTMLLILDGFGYREEAEGNAIFSAVMPNWDVFIKKFPHVFLHASGRAVGLPDGFIGNSEVGHLCLGAGRIVPTVLSKFHDAIDNKSFFKNDLLLSRFKELCKNKKALHLIGLLSDAGVHSHEKHFYAVIKLAKRVGIKKIYIHAILDGRDTPPKSAKKYLQKLDDFLHEQNIGVIASLHGRFYAMDRDNNWDRIEKSYNILSGKKALVNNTWQDLIDRMYKQGITDEFIEPVLLKKEGIVNRGDGVFFLNFRPDRARELSECFLAKRFDDLIPLTFFITTTCYNEEFDNDVLFEEKSIDHTLLDEIAEQTKKKNVFIAAETEKYAQVTYFFRGKRDIQLDHEKRVLVPSIKAKNYIEHPEMSADKITKKVIDSLEKDPAYFYLINYANCDMVGHSGNFGATVKACEIIDQQLGVLYKEFVEKRNGTIFLVSDHGNAEEMFVKGTKQPKTSHTTNPVPFMVIHKEASFYTSKLVTFGLANVAPTILKHLRLDIPDVMKKSIDFT